MTIFNFRSLIQLLVNFLIFLQQNVSDKFWFEADEISDFHGPKMEHIIERLFSIELRHKNKVLKFVMISQSLELVDLIKKVLNILF